MSYPYGAPQGGYPASSGYPTQMPYQPGGFQQPSSYPQMPTVESAMSGAYPPMPHGGPGMPQPNLGFNIGAGQPPAMGQAPPYQSGPTQPSYQPAPYGGPPQGNYPGQAPHPSTQAGYPAQPQHPYPAQQTYGLPPSTTGGYPAAPAPYQQPPGPSQYAPPSQAYRPPAAAGYGSQPGAPAPYQPQPGQYGAPTGYGGPAQYASSPAYASSMPASTPGGQYGYEQRADPTVKPSGNFNPESDSRVLRQAMRGLGTDEKAIIDVLAYRSNDQRQQIKSLYKTCFGKDLLQDLRSELGGRFEDAVLAVLMPSDEYDAYELKRAMRGLGTDEACLIEIMCTRSNQQITAIKNAYTRMYRSNLESDLMSETSGHFKRLMVSMANAGRMETQRVDPNKAREDAQRLHAAGLQRWGTDESTFNAVLASQSMPQLRAVFDEYQKLTGKTLENSIRSEMSGDLASGMVTIVRVVQDRSGYFADKLYSSMKGLGTDDRGLIRVVVTRCEVDMVQIKQAFQQKYGKTLGQFIRDDTSGDYRRMLVALVGEY